MGGKGDGGGEIRGPAQTYEGQQYLTQYPDVAESGLQPYYHYQTYGQQEGREWGQPAPAFGFEFPEFRAPEFGGGQDFAAQQAQAQADAEKRFAEGQIDQLYGLKFAAANQAAERINKQIAEEAGYARIGGADYQLSPEQKQERINNLFASLWSPEQESQLAGLEGQWGAAGNKWTSGIVRGVAPEEAGEGEEGAAAGGAVKPGAVFGPKEEEEELLGGATQALGGGL